jgi:hypothetical protein
MMTVLFGTIEYFEREILNYAALYNYRKLAKHQVLMIYSTLKDDLLNNFVCGEQFRMDCLDNLSHACDKLLDVELCMPS